MKKVAIFLLVLMVIAAPALSFAEGAREASGTTLTQTRSNFANVAAMGQNVTGNPGYLMLTGVAVSADSYVPEYYLWVRAGGGLCIASGPLLENSSEFPDGDWNNSSITDQCTLIGSQS